MSRIERGRREMILVVGATGALGGIVTRRLLEGDETVRILVRDRSTTESLVALGADVALGDLKDPVSLVRACTGVRAVITTANAAARGGADTFETVDDVGNHNLINAAVSAGVQRFMFISVTGSDPSSPVPLLRAKGLTEERLRASGMSYTILRSETYLDLLVAAVLAPAAQGRPVVLVGDGRRLHSFVAMADVAALAVATLDNPAAYDQTIAVGGPSPTTWRDLVATVESVLGRRVPIETIGLGQPIPGLPDLFNGVMTGLETFDSPIDMSGTSGTYGVELTSFDAWARETFGHLAAKEVA
jgi:NADH dehydrogenase